QLDNDVESLNYQLLKPTQPFQKYTRQLNLLQQRKKNQSQTNAPYQQQQQNLIHLLQNISNDISQPQHTYNSLKTKQKQLNPLIPQLQQQLYLSHQPHHQKFQ
ncbi:hypothetical protein, partial [Staphylococcus aureus]|uniref:hypothetical protein n=1 Tax=Staphylococcus aureus TaxID=1280 RepID=UPI001C92CC85